jgi:diguanylate cyclase (GGDEF)-like protein
MTDTHPIPIHDPLIGANTRGLLDEQLPAEIERTRRYGYPGSMIVFDLDHYKSVNDAFGHARGDQALVEVARRVQQNER